MAGTVKENLIAAKALIADPRNWIKGDGAPNSNCFCARGALAKAMSGDAFDWATDSQEVNALRAALPEGRRNIAGYNDSTFTTHADIMALFDRAIAAQAGAQ